MHIAQHIADIVVIRRRLSRARTLLQAKQRYVRALQGAVRCREMSWDVSCGISCMVIWRRSDMPCRFLSQDILEMLKKAPSGGRCDCESASRSPVIARLMILNGDSTDSYRPLPLQRIWWWKLYEIVTTWIAIPTLSPFYPFLSRCLCLHLEGSSSSSQKTGWHLTWSDMWHRQQDLA
jgi:hypothetical protein